MATIGDNPQNAAALDEVRKNMENQTDHGDVTTNKKPRSKRFPFPKVLPITFKPSPERLAEVERFRRTLQSPTIDIPVLVVNRQEDVLPVLGIYIAQEKEAGRELPKLATLSPASFGVKYFDDEESWCLKNDIKEKMHDIGNAFRKKGYIPIISGFSDYMDFDLMGEVCESFLKNGRPAILVVEEKDLRDVQSIVKAANMAINGVENMQTPYLRDGYARCAFQNVSEMSNDEKKTYFATHLKRMANESGMSIPKATYDYFAQTACERFSHPDVFSKIFEVLDTAIVLSKEQDESQKALSKDVLERAFDKVAPLHDKSLALLDMDERLKKKIFGQDKAISDVYELVLSGCDDADRTKPLVLGFFGPSGVGKTAMAEEMSYVMTGRPVACINMAEYADDFKMSILIGSSKGYVDSDKDGLLAQIVKENPRAVILSDEFEKAHPKVQRMFLGLFDKGSLYDNHAGEMNFADTTIVLTSNAGVKEEKTLGFGHGGEKKYVADMDLIGQSFPPELLGRIDAKILFEPLSKDAMSKVVDKFMDKFTPRFQQLGVEVKLSEKARSELIELGQNPMTGARPLMNVLRQKVKTPVEIGVLKKRIGRGSQVLINSVKNTDYSVLEAVKVRGQEPAQESALRRKKQNSR